MEERIRYLKENNLIILNIVEYLNVNKILDLFIIRFLNRNKLLFIEYILNNICVLFILINLINSWEGRD